MTYELYGRDRTTDEGGNEYQTNLLMDVLKRDWSSARGEHDRTELKLDEHALFSACKQDIPLSIFVAVEWLSLQ